MSYYKLFCICFFIINSFSAKYALRSEEIVGGYAAFEANFKYQAAIIGKYLGSNVRYLLCNGAIIADFYILSAAHCYIGKSNSLVKLSIFVLVGSAKLKTSDPDERGVDKIYTFMYAYGYTLHDIALLKLKESLQLLSSDILASLKIPEYNETFEEKEGLVAGYGAKKVDSTTICYKNRQSVTDKNIANLTYAYVTISSDEDCENSYISVLSGVHICGVMKPDMNYQLRGRCTNDGGAPLVYDDKVVGIALRNRPDCDDSVDGGMYTRTSYYKRQIDLVLAGGPLEDTIVFDNRQYKN